MGYVIGKQLAVRKLAASGVSIINEGRLEMKIELDNGWALIIDDRAPHGIVSPPTKDGYTMTYLATKILSTMGGVVRFISWYTNDEMRVGLTCQHADVLKSGESARCIYCGKFLGWWCPESPTHLCDYFHTRTVIDDGNEYSDEGWDSDDCIYCHQPEERK